MQLSPGAQLGSYEIKAALGAGGMGEVYRARDKKLERDVEIKVLPSDFAENPEQSGSTVEVLQCASDGRS